MLVLAAVALAAPAALTPRHGANAAPELLQFLSVGRWQVLSGYNTPPTPATTRTRSTSSDSTARAPSSQSAAVNAGWDAVFAGGIPPQTPLLGRCV